MCVCVLTGLCTEHYDQIMRWWGSEPQSGISQVLDSVDYCYVLPPHRPCYFIPCRSFNTSSSAHLGAPRLRPIISAYHTRLFTHLVISCLCPSIPTSQPSLPPPTGPYCVTFSPTLFLLLAFLNIPANVFQICFFVASWCHQASFLFPPHL